MKIFNQTVSFGLPLDITPVLLLLLPVVNFFLLLISRDQGFIDQSGLITFKGVAILIGILGLILAAAVSHQKYQPLFRILILLTCVSLPLVFVQFQYSHVLYQVAVIAIALFFLLYFLYFEKREAQIKALFSRALLLHISLLLVIIVFSTRLHLMTLLWGRISLLAYFCFCALFQLYYIHNYAGKYGYIQILVILVLSIVTLFSYAFSDQVWLFFFFMLAIYWVYLDLTEIEYDKFLINLLFENPFKLLIFSFGFMILVGALLLSMPFSAADGIGISLMDSLFTATSAICVTGLVVLDTYRNFSFAGQFIILVLIQIGGLGIITIMTFISVLLGQGIGIGREYIVGEIIGSKRPRFFYDLIRLIVMGTLIIETTGALLLSSAFYLAGEPVDSAIWKGIFHSVSSFCNAGFALQGDSLVAYNTTVLIPLTISILVIAGGIGFPVLFFLWEAVFRRPRQIKMPVSVKLTLIVTGVLLVCGYFFFLLLEYDRAFQGMPAFSKHLNAFFQSVTARTAGFNSIDLSGLSPASILVLWVLMFIGAGSCSTGGGIKVSTFGVLVAVIVSAVKGKSNPGVFDRQIPAEIVTRSVILLMASMMTIGVVAGLLMASQSLDTTAAVFETISAFGTVGLSLGATLMLDNFGKFLIIITMFIGRVNILTFIAMFSTTRKSKIKVPEEQIIIG